MYVRTFILYIRAGEVSWAKFIEFDVAQNNRRILKTPLFSSFQSSSY